MSRGPKLKNWVGDFETTTDENDCRVWGWGFASIDDLGRVEVGQDIDQFFKRIGEYDFTVYFHNLAFDGVFIMDKLFRMGYKHRPEGKLKPGEFGTLISKMGKYFSITVAWENGCRTTFKDSYKKLPMSVAAIADAFNMDIGKGDIDYHAPRPVGHEITPEERSYIERDVLIVAKALKVQLDSGMTRLTVGSDSLAEYRKLTGGKMFSRVFPILPGSMDAEIRRAYRGGFTYADERFKGKMLGKGRVYDVNSLYPSVMYDRMLPYGEPVFESGLPVATDEYPLFIVSVTFTAKLKKDHIPCIQVKGSSFFLNTEYQKVVKEPVTLMVTNIDLALWQEHYNMTIISYNGGWRFKGATGLFREYVDKWMSVKNKYEGGLKVIAKLHLNSLYGKFATNPDVTGKVPIFEDNAVKLVTGPENTRDPVYTPMGVFITAYARDVTVRAAQLHYDSFAYADTDSLHLLIEDDPDTLDVDKKRLGAWKLETVFDRALFIRAKAYTEQKTDGSYSTHIAGLPVQVAEQVTFENLHDGAVFTGKLHPKKVPGGVVLEDVGFTLKF